MNTVTLASHASQTQQRHPRQLTRWLTVSSLTVAGLAHIPVVPTHLSEAPYMGVLFILFTTVALAISAALAVRPSVLINAAAVILCASAIFAYAATRTVAFPQLADEVGAWLEPLAVLSVLTETIVVALGTYEIRRNSASAPPARSAIHA